MLGVLLNLGRYNIRSANNPDDFLFGLIACIVGGLLYLLYKWLDRDRD